MLRPARMDWENYALSLTSADTHTHAPTPLVPVFAAGAQRRTEAHGIVNKQDAVCRSKVWRAMHMCSPEHGAGGSNLEHHGANAPHATNSAALHARFKTENKALHA
eukprot:1157502-Pelagomonas_calceolata.AAC.6